MAPGETSPAKTAPEPLYLVQRFVNSVDLETGEDELATPEALRDWFAERGLMESTESVNAADLRRAIDVREGLRRRAAPEQRPSARRGAREEARPRGGPRAGVRVRFEPGRDPELVRERPGVDGAIAALMAIVAAGVESGRWERLKACPREELPSGPSTTSSKNPPAAGARWSRAGTSRRRGRSGSGSARAR